MSDTITIGLSRHLVTEEVSVAIKTYSDGRLLYANYFSLDVARVVAAEILENAAKGESMLEDAAKEAALVIDTMKAVRHEG